MSSNHLRLCAVKFGFALGLIWGLGMFCMALAGLYFQYALPAIQLVGSVYWGYAASWKGAFHGLGWGFLDFFIFGLLVAWVYNMCCGGCCGSSECN